MLNPRPQRTLDTWPPHIAPQPRGGSRARSGRGPARSVAAIHRHDAGTAEAEVVLQRDLGALDLAGFGLAAQVPDQLGALREAGGAERVALREQAAGRVGDELAAVGVVAVPDELLGAAFLAQAERLVGEQLVGGEAVVELDDVDVARADAGLLVDLGRGGLGHVVAD